MALMRGMKTPYVGMGAGAFSVSSVGARLCASIGAFGFSVWIAAVRRRASTVGYVISARIVILAGSVGWPTGLCIGNRKRIFATSFWDSAHHEFVRRQPETGGGPHHSIMKGVVAQACEHISEDTPAPTRRAIGPLELMGVIVNIDACTRMLIVKHLQ